MDNFVIIGWGLALGYLFVASLLGRLLWLYRQKRGYWSSDGSEDVLCVFGAIFWPFSLPIWIGVHVGNTIYKSKP